jgi:carboxylesterase type B
VPFINTDWDVWGPLLLLHKHALETQAEDTALAHTILETYTGTTAQQVTMEHLANLTDMFTDTYFMYGTHRLLAHHLEYSSGRLFTYVNSHVNSVGQANWAGIPLPGASHADELWLEFYPLIGQERQIGGEDARLSRQLTQMWTNFVSRALIATVGKLLSCVLEFWGVRFNKTKVTCADLLKFVCD